MTKDSKIVILGLLVMMFAVMAAVTAPWHLLNMHAAAPAVPAAPAGSQAPSAQFLTDYDQFLTLSADVAKLQNKMAQSGTYKTMQDEQDRANGMAQRLTAQVPQGYTFDAKYRAFLLRASPPPNPAAPAPPVASPPKK